VCGQVVGGGGGRRRRRRRRAGGGSAEPKTRTPHKDVGKNDRLLVGGLENEFYDFP